MSVLTPLCLTVAEYLEWEETNEVKHEFIDGELRFDDRRQSQIIITS